MSVAFDNTPVTVDRWLKRPPFGTRSVALLLCALLLLGWSGHRVELDQAAGKVGEAFGAMLGINQESQIGRSAARIGEAMFPPVMAERTEVSRIEGFDRSNLPFGSYVETERQREVRMNPATLQVEERYTSVEVVVDPFGYLKRVAMKMLETFEIAVWATILAVLLSAPLAYWGASNYAPYRAVYTAARAVVSFFRAIPELISAMFLVLAFGFGPVAGILALGFHAAGFLGKFYAEDIESSDPKPQEALRSLGAAKLKVLITAVIPQVLPQYVAYTLYILDRNVRMATVIGIVGAGGIGQELKGRYDMFNYGHVTTILIAIFITVFVLDQLSARIRKHLL